MGIYDRDYYGKGSESRGYGGGGGFGLGGFRFMSVNGWLIAINIGIFILGMMLAPTARPVLIDVAVHPDAVAPVHEVEPPPARLAPGTGAQRPIIDARGRAVGSSTYMGMDPLMQWGHFSTGRGFLGLEVWRFITFQFLHANFMHLFFNMLGLFIFGGLVEQYLGSRRYAAFYLVCGVFGAVAYLLLNFLGNAFDINFPGFLRGSILVPLIGASAGVFGVIMASAYVAPNLVVQLLLPPIPLKIRTLAYAYVAIAAANLLLGGRNAGGDAAHLGGAVAGWFFIRNAHLLRDFFDVFSDSRKHRGGGRPPRGSPGGGAGWLGRGKTDQAEVDRILAKVANDGLQSLTEKEKRALREATERQRGG
jgi:membrane associated rhomboid family serine protease